MTNTLDWLGDGMGAITRAHFMQAARVAERAGVLFYELYAFPIGLGNATARAACVPDLVAYGIDAEAINARYQELVRQMDTHTGAYELMFLFVDGVQARHYSTRSLRAPEES